jgi:predicted  nucleic acid-binding Zn-ribbon protein
MSDISISQIFSLKKEYGALLRELAAKDARIGELEAERDKAQDALGCQADLEKDFADARAKNEALRKELAEAKSSLSTVRGSNEMLERWLDSLKDSNSALRKRVGELEAELTAAAEDVKALPQKTADALMPIIGPLKARAEQAEAQLANTKAELRHMYTFDGQHRGKIADLTAQLAEAKEQAHYANGTAELAMKHRDAAEAQLEAHKIECPYNEVDLDQAVELEQTLRKNAEAQLAEARKWNQDLLDLARETRPDDDRRAAEWGLAVFAELKKARSELAEAKSAISAMETQVEQIISTGDARIAELEAARDAIIAEAARDAIIAELAKAVDDASVQQARAEQAEAQLAEAQTTSLADRRRAVDVGTGLLTALFEANRQRAAAEAQLAEIRKTHGIAVGVNEDLKDDLRAQLAVAREVCIGVDKVAATEEEIGTSKMWTPIWTNTVAKARAALQQTAPVTGPESGS